LTHKNEKAAGTFHFAHGSATKVNRPQGAILRHAPRGGQSKPVPTMHTEKPDFPWYSHCLSTSFLWILIADWVIPTASIAQTRFFAKDTEEIFFTAENDAAVHG
jgi:hypothetical protein